VDARIDRLLRASCTRPWTIGLGGGLPARELFPRRKLERAFVAAVRAPDAAALQYGWPEGDLQLRAWVASRLRARGADVAAEDVIVTSGAQQAIAISAQLLLGDGRAVVVDPETYPAALDGFRAVRARITLDADDAELACAYVMPGVGNPRGAATALAGAALAIARRVPVIADEAYAELRFDGRLDRPLLADARDRVFHVGTLSKTLCPGLRVGWLVPPRAFAEAALETKHASDLQAGSLAQAVVARFLDEDDFDARLARARRFYATRADALVDAIRRELPWARFEEPEGGFSVLVDTDLDGDDAALLARAIAHGTSFDPGRLFRASSASSPIAMRLCFSGNPAPAIVEGVRRLARAIGAHRRAQRVAAE
jgi:2-aminoadipate transaminase